MILIFSETDDTSTSKVIEWLIYFGVAFKRINREEINTLYVSCKIENDYNTISIEDGDKRLKLDNSAVIWFRRGELLNISPTHFSNFLVPEEIKKIFHKHLSLEIKAFYEFIYLNISKSVINNPLHYIPNKLNILSIAKSNGLSIPPTLITGKKSDLLDFLEIHKAVITKNIQDIRIIKSNGYQQAQRTVEIDKSILNEIPNTFCFSLFQKAISKKYEVRIFYFNNLFYAIANFSQKNKISQIDGRELTAFDGIQNRLTCFEVPKKMKLSIRLFMKEIKMNSGSFINPGNSNYYVEALIPQYNFGKVKTGQDVLLKLQAYPYQEFGSVKGRVEFISNVPSDSGYFAKIILPEGLITKYKKIVQYRTGLSMQADIITDKRRLLERFFSSFRSKLN